MKKVAYGMIAFLTVFSMAFSVAFAAEPISETTVQEEIFLAPTGTPMDFDAPELALQGGGKDGGGVAAKGDTVSPAGDFEPSEWRYGRETLSKREGGEYWTQVYDTLDNAIANFEYEVDVSDLFLKPTEAYDNLLRAVWMAIHGDHPEYFWLNPVNQGFYYEYYEGDEYLTTLQPYYLMDPRNPDDRNALERQKEEIERAANAWIAESGVQPSDSFYTKTRKMHDIICNKVDYNYSEKQPLSEHTVYDALVKRIAVCDGYVTTNQYLLSKIGVHAHFVGGKSYNPNKGVLEQHAWNLLQNGDKYYYTDITWDDQDDVIFYDYLNRTSEFMTESFHVIDMPYNMPVADDDSQSYFAQKENKDICIKSVEDIPTAIQSVIQQFMDGKQFARLYFDVPIEDTEIYWALFRSGGKASGSDGIKEIAKALKISGSLSYGHSYIFKEYHFLIFPTITTAQTKIDEEITNVLCVTCPKGSYLLSLGYYAPWTKGANKLILTDYFRKNPAFPIAGTILYKLPKAESLPSDTVQVKYMLWDGFDAIKPLYKPVTILVQ